MKAPGSTCRSSREFDIPLVLGDKLIDPTTGLVAFDTFNFDGLLGNTFLVNGTIQPFLEVKQRRYRFRVLDGGPSRFYQLFLTNPDNLQQKIPFFVISNDGNLLPRPIQATSFRMAVAERGDLIVDFKKIADRFGAKRLILENRLEQLSGRGPTGRILPAGRGDALMEFRIGAVETDHSFDPEPVSFPNVPAAAGDAVFAPISLPDISQVKPRLTRTFEFDRKDGQWVVNDKFMDCTVFRFQFQRDTAERWIIQGERRMVAPRPRPLRGVPHPQPQRARRAARQRRLRAQGRRGSARARTSSSSCDFATWSAAIRCTVTTRCTRTIR